MNFLAHLYLSGRDEEITVGNFIADAVKGNDYLDYPEGVAKGIRLHREIDHFTDHHPVFRNSKSRISAKYKLYSGVIIDIYYDHFLSKNWSEYSGDSLEKTVSRAYFLLFRKFALLPARSKRLLPYMVAENWLVGYRDFDRLRRVFYGMDRRTNSKSGMTHAVDDLIAGYQDFQDDFSVFFPEIISHINRLRCNL